MRALRTRLGRLLRPWAWPFTIKVPLVVALLMVAISAVLTQGVLTKLSQVQERHLEQLTGAYLDGLSTSIQPHVLRQDVWEVFDALDRATTLYKGLDVVWTTVASDGGQVLASSQPETFPSQSQLPQTMLVEAAAQPSVDIDSVAGIARVRRALVYQGQRIGVIHAEVRIGNLERERANVLYALLLTNSALTLMLAALGYAAVRRMVRPIRVLSAHLDEGLQGTVEPIDDAQTRQAGPEFGRVFRRYNALVGAVNERELLASKLAEEERLASLGRLASGMAHEINNPLGGMLNALDTLKRHGESPHVRATSLRLIEQGLTGIRELVRSTLATYRPDRTMRDLTATDLDDLRLLVTPEARRRHLRLDWSIQLDRPVPVAALPVRDATLNLLLNACHVSREGGSVGLRAGITGNDLVLDVTDAGPGLPGHVREYIERPGAGSAPLDRSSGLGLWIVKRLCDEIGGGLQVLCSGDEGSTIRLLAPLTTQELRDAA